MLVCFLTGGRKGVAPDAGGYVEKPGGVGGGEILIRILYWGKKAYFQ